MVTGSSPLARGLPTRRHACGRPSRIIPARAGFTPGRTPGRSRRSDHPRSRGVYLMVHLIASLAEGSSPLARGLLLRGQPYGVPLGIIPARAGFTRSTRRCPRGLWDHPRSRGVYFFPLRSEIIFSGSSPLARGLRGAPGVGSRFSGIIPARAGFTFRPYLVRYFPTGSSPLARGLHPPEKSP